MAGIDSEHSLGRLMHISEQADYACYEKQRNQANFLSTLNIDDLISWHLCQNRKHELFMLQEQTMCDMDVEAFILKSKKIGSKRLKFKERAMLKDKLRLNAKMRRKNAVKSENQMIGKHRNGTKPDC